MVAALAIRVVYKNRWYLRYWLFKVCIVYDLKNYKHAMTCKYKAKRGKFFDMTLKFN